MYADKFAWSHVKNYILPLLHDKVRGLKWYNANRTPKKSTYYFDPELEQAQYDTYMLGKLEQHFVS